MTVSGYWSGVLTALTSNLGWFSSSLYQCFLIPLALSVLALSRTERRWQSVLFRVLEILVVCLLGTAGFSLLAPLFSSHMAATIASHVLLLLLIAAYAVFRSPLAPSARVVVASAMFSEINWALSIAHLLFLPLTTLEMANFLQLLLLLVGFTVIMVFRPAQTERMPPVYWLIMLLIAVISFVSLTVVRVVESIDYNFGYHSPALRVLLPSFFVVSLLIYYLYYVLSKERRKAELLAAMQIKQARDLEFYNRTKALCGELHSLRHELKNHFTVMETMLRNRQYDKLEDYFQQVLGQNTPALENFHCDNPLVSSVISNAVSTAGAAGVRLDAVAAVPEALPVADADLCSLLSNLLDNGVEGCLAAGGGLVRASVHTEKGYLFITVANPAPADILEKNPRLVTTKRDVSGHGFGIPIIRRVAEKYNGCATFTVENGWFSADVMLCLEED